MLEGPTLSADERTVQRVDGGHCPYHADELGDLLGAQSNQFLTPGGPMQVRHPTFGFNCSTIFSHSVGRSQPQTHFAEEYARFFQDMLNLPEYQPCAVADAAAVLLHARSGVIRAAYDEDRAFWHRQGDADDELAFISAWARLRIAAVKRVVRDAAPYRCRSLPTLCDTLRHFRHVVPKEPS